MKYLNTIFGENIYEEFRKPLRQLLHEIDINIGLSNSSIITYLRKRLALTKEHHINDSNDAVLNDLFILNCYLNFFEHYGTLWQLISEEKFSSSWIKLQDALNVIRLLRYFSRIDMCGFETQLLELEKAYPYKLFLSIGAQVEWFECSICGYDIDSFECSHRAGQLYYGNMAAKIAHNINIDHIALVDHPQDRRCVISYDDSDEKFKLVRFISLLLEQRSLCVSNFGQLVFSKRLRPNLDYKKVGRNSSCFCGSRYKFKHCCISKVHIESDHVDIIPQQLTPEKAIN